MHSQILFVICTDLGQLKLMKYCDRGETKKQHKNVIVRCLTQAELFSNLVRRSTKPFCVTCLSGISQGKRTLV